MLLSFFYLAFGFAYVTGENCDKDGILIYEDLGCTPTYDGNATCPVKYSCLGLEPSSKNCYFRGKSYEDRERVDGSYGCHIACSCGTGSKYSHFSCAAVDCPEFLRPSSFTPGCYRKYSLNGCCSTGQICPPLDNIEKCVVDGKEYTEGQTFRPADTCLTCVCQKGFKGKFEEPFCRRVPCAQQLRQAFSAQIQDSCAPFYEADSSVLCCPDHWICPDGSEKIEGETKSEELCKFGDKTLKVGQHFKVKKVENNYGRSFDNVTCECVIPPLVKCVA